MQWFDLASRVIWEQRYKGMARVAPALGLERLL
jgi:hypothetical protein